MPTASPLPLTGPPPSVARPVPSRPGRRRPVLVEVLVAPLAPRTWVAQVHILYDLVVGGIVFGAIGIAVGLLAASACLIVAIPAVLWLMLVGARGVGMFERSRYATVLRVRIPDPYPVFTGTFWDRVRQRFTCECAWKELGYSIVLFPLATVGFTATIALWTTAAALLLLPVYLPLLPDDVARASFVTIHPGLEAGAAALAGLALLYLVPWVARGWVALDVFVARNLLGRGVTAELEERVDVLETTRSWALEVAEAERRRIERDLHDGAQQRLVALALELGMAREKLDSDPEGARELIEKAHGDAKAAIAELRDLARGIHPPDLGETGLPGAIPVLAGRCPVPVSLEVSVPRRPSPSIEGIAYFIVSECLANVAKHAGAHRAAVRVTQESTWASRTAVPARSGRLIIEVSDDGTGGAGLDGPGSGLRGLADRVASVDGRFTVSSPEGGPTIIRAELPCAS